MAGLETAIEFIKNLRFDKSDLNYLATLKDEINHPLFEDGFLKYLSEFQFSCDIDAIEEGALYFHIFLF